MNKLQFNTSTKIMDLLFVTSLCFRDFGKENAHHLSWEEKWYLSCFAVNFTDKEIYYLFVPTNAHTYILKYYIILQTLLHVSMLLHHLQGAVTLANAISKLPEDGAEVPKHVGAFVV